MCYSVLSPDEWGYDKFRHNSVFFESAGPKKVHIHVERVRIADIPGIRDSLEHVFASWLRARFEEKDSLLAEFYDTGKNFLRRLN